MSIHYNFCREHSALGGKTPAEVAGLKLDVEENRIEYLMRIAAKQSVDT